MPIDAKVVPPETPAMLWAVQEAEAGRRVAVVLHEYARNLRPLFDMAWAVSDPEHLSRTRKVNGAERLEYASGGSIDFCAPPSRCRGLSVDSLVIDEVIPEHLQAEVMPVLVTAKDAKILRFDSRVGRAAP